MELPRLDSRIDEVTVYASGALVSRVAEVGPVEGAWPERVRIAGLPLALEDRSLRVRIDGGAGGPVAADLRVALEIDGGDDSLLPAEDPALRAARLDEARLRDRIEHLGRRLSWLERLHPGARPRGKRGEAPPAAPTAARLSLLALRADAEAQLLEQLTAARGELRRAEERRRDLEEQDRRRSSARQAREHQLRKSAVITLRPPPALVEAPARLRLEYLVPGARWAPAYSLRLDDSMSRAELAVRALVSQRTGEDWSGVRLLLSTADALAWCELPEPTSLRIGRQQPPPRRTGWRAPPAGVDELFADYDRAMRGLVAPALPGAATIREPTLPIEEEHAPAFDEITTPYEGVITKPMRPTPRAGLLPPMSAPSPAQVQQSFQQAISPVAAGEEAFRGRPKARGGVLSGFFGGGGDGGGGLPPQPAALSSGPPPEPTWNADDRLLAYGDLRMPPAGAASRGRLAPADRATLYVELLTVQQTSIAVELLRTLDAATDAARASGEQPPPPRCAYPSPATGYDYAYAADAPVDVPADGDFHSLPLTAGEGDAVLRYVAVPRESADVFRFAEVMSPLASPLLDGPIDVYVGGDFLVAADLRFTPPRGRVRLGLGVEQAIKMARNTDYEEEAAGLMGGSLALRHEIRIELENHLPRVVSIEVRERVPVAAEGDDDVEVDLGEVTPAWEDYEQEPPLPPLRGGHAWNVTLGTGEQKLLRATYTVKIAARNELVGGNRRDG